MNAFADRVAVITGAGSGIGRALAVALASKGARLALSDVDTAGLAATVRRVEAFGADVEAARVDVSEREAVFRYAGEVVGRFGRVHQLYNNAGIEYHGAFERSALEDVERIMNVDFWGVVNFSKAFLPHLIASRDGHLVNVSSLFGLMSVPGQSAYSSAKFAVRGFTESLRQEMLAAGHPVKVTCAPEQRQDGHRTQRGCAGRRRPSRSGQPLRPQAGPYLARRRGTDDSARRPQEQGTCPRRRRREVPRRLRPHRGAFLPARHRGRRGASTYRPLNWQHWQPAVVDDSATTRPNITASMR